MIPVRLIIKLGALAGALWAAACQTPPTEPPQPALITEMTPETQARIEAVVSEALGGRTIRISDQDLSGSSTLIIEPPSVRSRDGMPIDGRSMEKPDHFDLMLAGTECYLLHRQSGQKYRLDDIGCVAAP